MRDLNLPLRWEHEDGRSGVEVSEIAHRGRVTFLDDAGEPVFTVYDGEEFAWWVHLTVTGDRFVRITRILVRGGYTYLVPLEDSLAVFVCAGEEHATCERGQCNAAATLARAQLLGGV